MQEAEKDRISTHWTVEDDNFCSVQRKTVFIKHLANKLAQSWEILVHFRVVVHQARH